MSYIYIGPGGNGTPIHDSAPRHPQTGGVPLGGGMGYGRGARLTYGGGGRDSGFHPVRRGGKASSTASPIRERSRSGSDLTGQHRTGTDSGGLPPPLHHSVSASRFPQPICSPPRLPRSSLPDDLGNAAAFWVLGAVPLRLPDLTQNLPR